MGRGMDFRIFLGIVIIILGLTLLAKQFYPDIDAWSFFWPLAVILAGFFIIFRGPHFYHRAGWNIQSARNKVQRFVGDVKLDYKGRELGNVDASNLIGDLTLDLTGARLAEGVNNIDVSHIIGDALVLIPRDFPLRVSARTILGEITLDRRKEEGFLPHLEHSDPGYDDAPRKLFVGIDGILGDLTLQRV